MDSSRECLWILQWAEVVLLLLKCVTGFPGFLRSLSSVWGCLLKAPHSPLAWCSWSAAEKWVAVTWQTLLREIVIFKVLQSNCVCFVLGEGTPAQRRVRSILLLQRVVVDQWTLRWAGYTICSSPSTRLLKGRGSWGVRWTYSTQRGLSHETCVMR